MKEKSDVERGLFKEENKSQLCNGTLAQRKEYHMKTKRETRKGRENFQFEVFFDDFFDETEVVGDLDYIGIEIGANSSGAIGAIAGEAIGGGKGSCQDISLMVFFMVANC
ncbi:hypothetical protein Nepgr_018196 [Nepenthes gracilis]|uniref:Uncharacterized protein n=1 Tax=Nepenthes gracilis TaxID=150966 RepID=A0AAD3SQV1_NEPGR|nr:hypothetical protein Nepgr_018196 [Nepenthes gracilis]